VDQFPKHPAWPRNSFAGVFLARAAETDAYFSAGEALFI
jgi:hypothetical protein